MAESNVVHVLNLGQCKLHIVILDYDWLKDNINFSKPMISRKMITVFQVQFGINCTRRTARPNSFFKSLLGKLITNWTQNRMITNN